jgi:hypothetical protein
VGSECACALERGHSFVTSQVLAELGDLELMYSAWVSRLMQCRLFRNWLLIDCLPNYININPLFYLNKIQAVLERE